MRAPRRTRAAALLVGLLAVTGAACSSSNDNATSSSSSTGGSASSSSSGTSVDYASLKGTLNGSGSSFQDALEQAAITQFKAKAPDVAVSYTKSGSSAGKQDLQNGVVQFAGTDSLIKDADKPKFKGGEVLYFPLASAPITVSFHLNGVSALQLSPATVAGIFTAKITKWDAAEIKSDNPGATLPGEDIVVVHRSDGSGTTSNFTKYLAATAPSVFTLTPGDTVDWPSGTQGAEKNSGVASLISNTEGAIGYVDLSDAVKADLTLASIKNKAGNFTKPTLVAASAAVAGASVNADLTYSPLNSEGADAYPITSPTWIIVYAKQGDPATAAALKGYLTFMLTEGQTLAPTVGYAALPEAMVTKAMAQLARIAA